MKTAPIAIAVALQCVASLPASAQTRAETERAVRAVADRLVREATFDFVDSATGQHYAAADSAPRGAKLRLASPYNDWRYWNGVINLAMPRLAGQLEDANYFAYSARNVVFAFDNAPYFQRRHQREDKSSYPFGQLFTMEELDDYGVNGGLTTGMLVFQQDPRWTAYVEKASDYIANRQTRLADSTFARNTPRRGTVWADDLFMSVYFLLNFYGRTGDARWIQDARQQIVNFNKYLFDPRAELMYHNYYADSAKHGVAFWARANGWALMAEAEVLRDQEPIQLRGDTLLVLFRRHASGIARYQDRATGLWHQVLDKRDSYLETSASAMFVYAIAYGVNKGYLAPSYADVARRGWRGVMSKIHADGQIEGTSAGTGVSDKLADYYQRPQPLNDPHGIGPVLLAGREMLRLK